MVSKAVCDVCQKSKITADNRLWGYLIECHKLNSSQTLNLPWVQGLMNIDHIMCNIVSPLLPPRLLLLKGF